MGAIKINWDKVEKELPTMNEYIDTTHGKVGTPQREEFQAKALAYYYGELIREARKERDLTQEELAKKVGKNRAYIAKIEQGKTDLQLSNFLALLRALDLSMNIG
ncbi:helix-turn-helix domain-containing protein [Riemerella anatipestifer]|uniref:Helix-turn-helix domain-containing protein n=1 Tax=Riemerella anatipestifer TaxID=34085 RepID=A0AAP3AQX6_RIEAN|nr:helix-turn-helix transcriptional regulator [Riemerella anatipestifer]MCD5969614.1 helix-turn-helix domain-containing protein [Riemerella anatipestifer]MCU7540341.1 helix-turn-helix domain-containing protein [Riemerella anatipestifer]MCU7569208.1 helix-turn-helix domain-containing protein [Riemerella anatipestifer]MCU7571042.1 helix-turn-helix domain-containing protein [Riemerella anatipestifer]MCU7597681.1 helix-turn-helix domain-containing protein [Riemerella anatipestifer]